MATSVIKDSNVMSNVKCLYVEKGGISIPANGLYDLSIQGMVPSGYWALGTVVKLSDGVSNYSLPYTPNASTGTWVELVSRGFIRIKNTTSAWNNYNIHAVVFCVKS